MVGSLFAYRCNGYTLFLSEIKNIFLQRQIFFLVSKFYTIFSSLDSVLVSQACFSWFHNLCLQTWTQEWKRRAAWSLEHPRGHQAKLTYSQQSQKCPCVSEIRQLQPQLPRSSQPQWPSVRNLAISPGPLGGARALVILPHCLILWTPVEPNEQEWDESCLKRGAEERRGEITK